MKRWFRRYSLSAGSAGYGVAMALVLALLLLASGVTPAAAATPEPPHQFYGNVYIGGSLAAVGTKIEARVNNVKQAETTVDSSGRYGYSQLFKVPGSTGPVTFYIGTTTKAVQSVAWQSGGINRDDGQPLHLSDTAIDLTITTTSLLPDGQVGTFYTRTLAASGGTAPYTWSVSAGSPPTGLSGPSASGVISGTPTVAETATFTVQVTDAVMAIDTQALSITIGTSTPPGDGQKLIGRDDDSSAANEDHNYIIHNKWTAAVSGTMNRFFIRCNVAGNVKCAIYSDSSGAPGTLINSVGSTAISPGWVSITFPDTPIVQGTVYWLTINSDTKGTVGYKTGTGLIKYKAFAFATDFPNPAGTGYYDYPIAYANVVAGWGGTVAAVAPAAPTRDCSALTFKWNAATGATKYLLQVNTNSGFTGTDMFNAEVGNVLYREVTGLTAGITYYWRVKAGNTAGWSDWSSTGSIVCQ